MIPIYSAMLKWMGSVTASNKNLRDSLKIGSCAVVVDGIAGMYVNEPKKEMIKFSVATITVICFFMLFFTCIDSILGMIVKVFG